MRLSVRWQLVLVLVTLSLVPMAVSGVAAYRSARGALDQSIRFNLESLAVQTEERLERLLLDRQVSLRGWSQLRLIQDDTVTADADGRILQFLQDAKRNFELQELWVANAAGQVIASTIPGMHGREVGDRLWFQTGAKRRGVGRRARNAGVHQTRRHADRRAAQSELRSVACRRRPRRGDRLAEGGRDAAEREGPARGSDRSRLPAAGDAQRHRAERAASSSRDGRRARRISARSASMR